MLDIRPLLWKDGWPVAGENLKEGDVSRSNPCAPVRRSSLLWRVCRWEAGAAEAASGLALERDVAQRAGVLQGDEECSRAREG